MSETINMPTTMRIVYTKSGSKYFLDEANMKFSSPFMSAKGVWWKLTEWPSPEVGQPLWVRYKETETAPVRLFKTSAIIGIV